MIRYFEDMLHDGIGQYMDVSEVIMASPHDNSQDVSVIRNETLGKVLLCDGIVQTTEADAFVYNEMMVHVPMMASRYTHDYNDVLLIGLGAGYSLKEIMRHQHRLRSVDVVEINPDMLDVVKIFGNDEAFSHPKVSVCHHFEDAVTMVPKLDREYTSVIIDMSDPVGCAYPIFQEEFLYSLREKIAGSAIVTLQVGVPFFQAGETMEMVNRFRKVFGHGGLYVFPVPTYYGGFMAVAWGSIDATDASFPCHTYDIPQCRYYNQGIHHAAFQLPQYVKDMTE